MNSVRLQKRDYVIQGALWFTLWVLVAALVQSTVPRGNILLPGPWDVVAALPALSSFAGASEQGDIRLAFAVILEHSLASGGRLIGGVALGLAAGFTMGLLLGWSPKIRAIAGAPLFAIRTIPILALIPLFLSWFGGANIGAIFFIAFGVFAMILVNTVESVNNVSDIQQRYARTLGASRFRVYRSVVVPAIVPELSGAVRVVIGFSWALLLAAEYLAAQDGLGRILILAQQYSMTSRMVLILILIIVYTVLVDRGFRWVSGRMTTWVPR